MPSDDASAPAPQPRTYSRRILARILRRRPAPPRRALPPRPQTRGDCREGPRPCLWVGCRYNLYLEVNRSGSIVVHDPDREPWELAESCALDVAERGGTSLEQIGRLFGLTRERVRQIESAALRKLLRRFRGEDPR